MWLTLLEWLSSIGFFKCLVFRGETTEQGDNWGDRWLWSTFSSKEPQAYTGSAPLQKLGCVNKYSLKSADRGPCTADVKSQLNSALLSQGKSVWIREPIIQNILGVKTDSRLLNYFIDFTGQIKPSAATIILKDTRNEKT